MITWRYSNFASVRFSPIQLDTVNKVDIRIVPVINFPGIFESKEVCALATKSIRPKCTKIRKYSSGRRRRRDGSLCAAVSCGLNFAITVSNRQIKVFKTKNLRITFWTRRFFFFSNKYIMFRFIQRLTFRVRIQTAQNRVVITVTA